MDGLAVLDIGCGNGRDLTHALFAKSKRYGVDVLEAAIDEGQRIYPQVSLTLARAEYLPFPDGFFDVVMSRVALPYTDLDKSLAECRRVLKPGGHLYITMHDYRHQWGWVKRGLKERAWKRLADCFLYIYPASVIYNLTGIAVRRPWKRCYETFQMPWRLRRHLAARGFTVTRMERGPRHFEIEAC